MKIEQLFILKNNLLLTIVGGVFIGIFLGLFILFPINEFVNYFEYYIDTDFNSVWHFLQGRISGVFRFEHPSKYLFYGIVGATIGLVVATAFRYFIIKIEQISVLQKEIDENIEILIAKGESSALEFKSSFRWDIVKAGVNKALEKVIIKTISGFLNSQGGTLLIGVDDEGEILGLDNDYKTMKRRDRDGYEQMIIGSISSNIGANQCKNVQVLFHEVNAKDVCRIVVSPSSKPVYVDSGNNTKFYLRTGGGTRELNVHEAIDYVSSKWGNN